MRKPLAGPPWLLAISVVACGEPSPGPAAQDPPGPAGSVPAATLAPAPPAPAPPPPLSEVEVGADTVYEVQGSKMVLNPADTIVSRVIARDGIWEPLETEVFRSKIGPGDVVVDVGANLGYYTLLASRLVGEKGRVYAFEPDPESFAILQRNIALNGYSNVTAVQVALGREPGKLRLYLNAENRGDHRVYDPTGERESVEVEVVALDAYLKGEQAERVDFLKIDTQGAECTILAGASETLARSSELVLVLEFTPHFLAQMGDDPRACLSSLVEAGFGLHDIDEWKREVQPTDLDALLRRYPADSRKFTNLLAERPPAD